MADITLEGNPFRTNGELPAAGTKAPDFKLVDKDLADVSLANFAGKQKLISIVPSLDTGVCATSTKVFNERLGARSDVAVLIVSADLPFAQGRFCSAEGTDNVATLSMMRSRNFAKDYGMLIENGPLAGITGRAVVVLNEADEIVYTELVSEIGHEPDYDAAISALA